MDKIRDYLENNFKLAYKSVRFHFKKFAFFYVVLFIIELMLGTVSVSLHINKNNIRDQVKEQYNSHCVFYYMNTNQMYYLKKSAVYYFENDHFFDVKDIKKYGNEEDYDFKCDVSIVFAGDPEKSLDKFNKKYLPKLEALGNVYMTTTPLFDLDNTLLKCDFTYGLYLLIVSIFSLILLIVLYSIHSNGSGFEYGIYMSFGADRKKLFNTSFWELSVISLLTLLPAMISSGVLNFILAKKANVSFSIGLTDCFIVFLLTLTVIAVSVFGVITKTSRKEPVSLLTSQDNSNLVHSPRTSRNVFLYRNTKKMRRVSFFRYFRYYATLTLSAVLFASLFVCGSYSARLYKDNLNSPKPQFEVTYTGNKSYTDEDTEYYLGFEGIIGTNKKESTYAMSLNEHVLVSEDSVKLFADVVDFDSDFSAIDNVIYYCTDREVVNALSSHKHTGDLYSVFENENTVIISDSYCNKTKFTFTPGDKIKLADFLMAMKEPSDPLMGNDLLKFRLENYLFLYKEVTIGAVIHDAPSEFLNIYLPPKLYTDVTKNTPEYKQVMLYTDPTLTNQEINKLYSDILRINQLQYRDKDNSVYVFVKNLYTDFEKQTSQNAQLTIKLTAVSSFVLCISAILWFFSQLSFYKKRSNEYTLLKTVGFTSKDVKKLFMYEAVLLSALSVIIYFIISYAMCYSVYYIMNSWMFGYIVRYSLNIPSIPLIIGAIATVVFAFISTFVCYRNYSNNKKITVPKD